MNIIQIADGKNGAFVAQDDLKEAGRVSFLNSGYHTIIIDHTFLKPMYRNNNIGRSMIMNVVDYARENDLKIIPRCSFAKYIFEHTPEIQDVLL